MSQKDVYLPKIKIGKNSQILNVTLPILVIVQKFKDDRITTLQVQTLTNWFLIQIMIIHDNISIPIG